MSPFLPVCTVLHRVPSAAGKQLIKLLFGFQRDDMSHSGHFNTTICSWSEDLCVSQEKIQMHLASEK